MRWKEIAVGAAITLIVSVLAGVLVWFLTTYRTTSAPFEEVGYQVENIATFNLGATKLGFVRLKVLNSGSKVAKNLRIIASFPASAEIREREMNLSTRSAGEIQDNTTDRRSLDVTLPSLAPSEVFSASLLVSGENFKPDIIVRSSETIGTAKKIDAQESNLTPVSIVGLIVMALIAQMLIVVFLRRSRERPTFETTLNNTAFLYIQRKRIQDAQEVLDLHIKEHGATIYEFANSALLAGLRNDLQGAEDRFVTAEWLATSKYHRAVIIYNRATLALANGDLPLAKRLLASALDLAPKHVLAFCRLSTFVAEAITKDASIGDMLQRRGLNQLNSGGVEPLPTS
jgi:hypothetical protein